MGIAQLKPAGYANGLSPHCKRGNLCLGVLALKEAIGIGIVDVVEDILAPGLQRGFSPRYRGRRVLSTNILPFHT